METTVSKRCLHCTEVKPAAEFSLDQKKRDGLASYCRPCDAQKSREYYERNRERKKQVHAALYQGIRASAVAIYGGCCESCGDRRSLEFDHVNGGGNDHRRKEHHKGMLRRIVATGAPIEDHKLRLLCSACHRGGRVLLSIGGQVSYYTKHAKSGAVTSGLGWP